MHVCYNKPLELVVSCINDPELDKKIEGIMDDYERTSIQVRGMELGSAP